MTNEQLLAEADDLLRNMPPRPTIRHETQENLSWLGRVAAVIETWNPSKASTVIAYLEEIRSLSGTDGQRGVRALLTLLYQARHDLQMKTVGPTTIAFGSGHVFDYFDELRKVIELAKQELFFIDPYLDAEFISRYLPHIMTGVSIRLLAREKLPTLIPAVDAWARQSKMAVQVRSSPNFHDRYVIVDRMTCYQSGASFKDGAKSAPTTLTQITDAFIAVLTTYHNLWNKAKIEK